MPQAKILFADFFCFSRIQSMTEHATIPHGSLTRLHTFGPCSDVCTQTGIALLVWWWHKKRLLPVGWTNSSFHNVNLRSHIPFVKYAIKQGLCSLEWGTQATLLLSIQLLENRLNGSYQHIYWTVWITRPSNLLITFLCQPPPFRPFCSCPHLKLYNPALEIFAPQNGGAELRLHVTQL